MSFPADDPRVAFMPIDDVLKASGHVDAVRNAWWTLHPETKALVFWQPNTRRKGQLRDAFPQCNRDETIARAVSEKLWPWAEVAQVPLVLIPINVSDFA